MDSHAKLPASARIARCGDRRRASRRFPGAGRHEAAADHRAAPEQAAERSAADCANGHLVMPRRAAREQVLESRSARGAPRSRRAGSSSAGADSPLGSPPLGRRGQRLRHRLRDEIESGVRPLPQVAREPLREKEPGVTVARRDDDRRPDESVHNTRPPSHAAAIHNAEIAPCAVRK